MDGTYIYQPSRQSLNPDCYGMNVSYHKRKMTANIMLGIGLLFTVGIWVAGLVLSCIYVGASETVQKIADSWFADWFKIFSVDGTGMKLVAGLVFILYIALMLYMLLCSVGFLFGIRYVWRVIRRQRFIVIVFSIIFFALTIGIALTVAHLSAGVVMIKDFRELKKEKQWLESQNIPIA